jgi:hypothetical protein
MLRVWSLGLGWDKLGVGGWELGENLEKLLV